MEPYPVTRIAHIQAEQSSPGWLVTSLWGEQAVGFIAGTPKSGKTWLALELAVAVASGRPCLGRFTVRNRGHVLLYAAEDSALAIKHRVAGIAKARGIDMERLAVGLITEPGLRLDDPDHQERLGETLTQLKPRLLVLDPLVRLHRGDENSASDISQLLAYLRHLQRQYGVAVALVHHVRKSAASQPGQALLGSGDLHAWSDSSLYLLRRKDRLELHAEHRSHPNPKPFSVELHANDPLHLRCLGEVDSESDSDNDELVRRILDTLAVTPMTRTLLRERLSVRNERLGTALASLELQGRVQRIDGRLTVNRSRS